MVYTLRQPDLRTHRPAIDRVPYEVLSEIFLFYLNNPQETPHFWPYTLAARPAAPTTPLLLGAVNITWRNVAWTTPRLWTTVSFKIIKITKNLEILFGLVEEWIQRAGVVLPLSINVTCHDSHRSLPFINLLKEHRHRWQKMDCRCDDPYVFELLLRNDPDTYLSNLKVVHFTVHHSEHLTEAVELDLTADSPEEIYGFVPLSWIKTQWQALKSIGLSTRLPVDQLMHVLRDAPALTFCSANLDFIKEINIEVHPIVHYQLDDIRLRFYTYPEDDGVEQTIILEELLSKLSSPSLTKLIVNFDEELNINFDAAYADTLMNFLARSRCSLKTLEQHGVIFSNEDEEDQLLAVLMATPALEHLTIATDVRDSDKGFSDHFLECLSVQKGDPNLLPKLKYFTYYGPLGFSEEALAMISCEVDTAPLGNPALAAADNGAGGDPASFPKLRLMERIEVELNDGFDDEGNYVHEPCPPQLGSVWKKIMISV